MCNGPFRPYEEPSTQQCLQDIMDGYFPSELQTRYPNGIPLQVTDKRDVVFQERRLPRSFPGHGQVVGVTWTHFPSALTGPKLSLEQFLNKLPKSLIRGGQVIDVRDSIRATLQVQAGPAQVHNSLLLKAEPPAPDICTLRIKSETGEQTYIVKMLFTETIGDLRQHLTHTRGGDSESYEIISTFPQRVYMDNSQSLQDCGLIPNASLLLREKTPSNKGGQGSAAPGPHPRAAAAAGRVRPACPNEAPCSQHGARLALPPRSCPQNCFARVEQSSFILYSKYLVQTSE
uniref:UBX domain-containing protein 11 n=1 Tax=Apteryx owenii TaxID=8824 RepID=A0A8B9PTT8_APTOW